MKLTELQISNLRNIRSARLNLHPHMNIISGPNGSGKTSCLEALYLLSNAFSFRSRENQSLISNGDEKLALFAKTDDFQQVSLQKSLKEPTIARLNGQNCSTRSALVTFLPSQVFYQDIFQLIDAGPSLRRGLLDWGMFHVEHSYHGLWNDYRRVLKQRNSLLKQKVPPQQFLHWDSLLSDLGNQLHELRLAYCSQLFVEFTTILKQLSDVDAALCYYKGWDKKNEGKILLDILQHAYPRDLLRQYTHYGAHNADLVIVSQHFKVKQFLSRGQQKMVLFAIKLAQIKLLNRSCMLLIDDMASELDEAHIQKIMDYLVGMDAQIFITLRPSDAALLHARELDCAHFQVENGVFHGS